MSLFSNVNRAADRCLACNECVLHEPNVKDPCNLLQWPAEHLPDSTFDLD